MQISEGRWYYHRYRQRSYQTNEGRVTSPFLLLSTMTREELNKKIEHLMEALENTQRSIQFTNIPVYVLTNYIKEETGIDMEQVKE